MSIIATIDTGGQEITGTFETKISQGKEYVVLSQTDTGTDVGILIDNTNVHKVGSCSGLAVHRVYRGKLALSKCSVLPEVES
jgi:hypothetical protein